MKRIAAIAALLLMSAAATADEDPMSSRFFVMLGGFWPDVNTTVRADGNGGRIGTRLDFESDLGLDDRDTLFTGGIGWRIAKRHFLDVLYFKLSRSGARTTDISFSFKDQDFSAQTTIDTYFDTEVFRISYGYSFIDSDRQRLLGQIGAHYTKVAAGIRRDAVGAIGEEASSDVPLPVLGLVYDYRFTPRFSVDLRAQIFRLNYEDIDGSLDNLSASLQYAFTPKVAVFAGYNYYSIDVDANRAHWRGSFDFGYKGPWAGVTVGFGELH